MSNITQLVRNSDRPMNALVGGVASFLEAEADCIHEILETLGQFDAADAILEMIDLCNDPRPNPHGIASALRAVRDALHAVPFLVVEHAVLAELGPRDLRGAIRWYGARIAEYANCFESRAQNDIKPAPRHEIGNLLHATQIAGGMIQNTSPSTPTVIRL